MCSRKLNQVKMAQKFKKSPSVLELPSSIEARNDLRVEDVTYEIKLSLAKSILKKIHQKLPHRVDSSIFKELERIAAILETEFINQRSPEFLAKIAYSIFFIRKKIDREIALRPMKDHYDVHVFPSSLHFIFGSKPVLGILSHVCLKDKYEAFDEEHVLLAIRKFISEAQLVKNSVYGFQPPKSMIKTLYFEIEKKSGLPFSIEEIKRLKSALKQEIQFCIEQLTSCIFMARNEEEILRNILTLSQEIDHPSDLPQVMILFDEQTPKEAIFTVILIRVNRGLKALSELFLNIQMGDFTFSSERCQIVRYLAQNYPIEANVFKIHLPKDASLLRADLSLNFYLTREKVSSFIVKAIGEFRDFNGGIILKQREGLASFMEAFPDISYQNPDLLENFFYSLSPIESQATLPLVSLKTLFESFLEALRPDITKPSDYFFNFRQVEDQLFLIIRIPDPNFKESLEQLFSSLNLAQGQAVTSTLCLHNTTFFSYIIAIAAKEVQDRLVQSIAATLKEWKQKLEQQQVLRLSLENPVVSLDPRVGGDQISSIFLKLVFEGLMREDKYGKIEYGIAERVDISPDFKNYTFYLKTTRWSDGSLLSAFDFEYAWKKVLSPTFKTPFAYLFYPIKGAKLAKEGVVPVDTIGIKALDDLTLKVELRFPSPYFLELVAHTIYSPVHRVKDQLHPNWSQEENEAYICNGAFQLMKNQPRQGYEFVKNPLYWDAPNIQLDRVIVLQTNRYQAYKLFHKNNSHWVGVPLSTLASSVIPSVEDELITFSSKENVYWCAFNCQKPPFNNKKLRQAFALAINREELASDFGVELATSPLPSYHSLVSESLCSRFDLEKAIILYKQALEDMELSPRDFPLVTFIYLANHHLNKVWGRIKEYWEKAFNIQCRAIPVEWNVLFPKLTRGDFQLGGITWKPWVNDPIYTLNTFLETKDPINFAKWTSAHYREILYHAEREIDQQKKRQHYLQAEEILLEEMPVIPLFSNIHHSIKKKRLIITIFSQIMNFKWARFESSSD